MKMKLAKLDNLYIVAGLLFAASLECRATDSQHLQDLQRFLEEPEPAVEVREGANVTLACRVANKLGTLQWTKDDFGLGTDRELAGFARYRMTGGGGSSPDDTTWNLAITNVTLEDTGRYQCQVGATDTAAPIRSAYAELSVLAAPQAPVITAGGRLVVREGKTAMVQCISKGGRPAAAIRWFRDNEEIAGGDDDGGEISTKVETMLDGKRTATVSTLTFAANRSMAGARLECEAWNAAAEAAPRTVATTLEVEYEPAAELRVVDPDGGAAAAVYEGDSVRVACSASARPAAAEIRWEVGGEEVAEARGAAELVIDTVDRHLHDKTVVCTVRNKLGQASAQHKLNIKCEYRFLFCPIFLHISSFLGLLFPLFTNTASTIMRPYYFCICSSLCLSKRALVLGKNRKKLPLTCLRELNSSLIKEA